MGRIIDAILKEYGIAYRRVLEPQKGYRNTSYPIELSDGEYRNLIVYKQEPGIEQIIRNADRVSSFVEARGYAARQPYGPILAMRPKGSAHGSKRTRYARLYDYLPGETIAWEAYTKRHIKLIGKTMSDMHADLQDCDTAGLPDIQAVNRALSRTMAAYFSDPGVRQALKVKLRLSITGIGQLLDPLTLVLPHDQSRRQPLHMDFVRGNLLFSDNRTERSIALEDGRRPFLTGILDFEKTAAGHPLYDVARTLAFLLVDCKGKAAAKVGKYFVASGYIKRGGSGLRAAELKLLDRLVRFYLLHDFYKFLRHNPYESLEANQHFCRTRDFLLRDGIIKQT